MGLEVVRMGVRSFLISSKAWVVAVIGSGFLTMATVGILTHYFCGRLWGLNVSLQYF